MEEIEFIVEEREDGSFVAHSLGACVMTEAADLEMLKLNIKEALCCHFDPGCEPRRVKLRFVRFIGEESLVL